MTETARRRTEILLLLSGGEIRSQTELRDALRRRGHLASQPALSRDLRALRVAKHDGAYRVLEEDRVTPLTGLRSLLRGVSPVTHFRLISSEPGAASAVARALEAEEMDGVVGTVAGDDAVLVALSSAAAAGRVDHLVHSLL